MAKVKRKKRKSGSLFIGAVDRFTAFICSVFANGRLGTWLSSGDAVYKNSFFTKMYDKTARKYQQSALAGDVDLVMKRSKFAKATDAIRVFLSNLSLGVYGFFFAAYGTASAFVYFIPIFLWGENTHGESALITSAITLVCAIPMAVSTKSFISAVSESRFLKNIVLSFFAIPEEKLKSDKRTGGAIHILVAAFLGLALSGLTYFMHPAYIFVFVGVIAVWCIISANPESGVTLTLTVIPFLQYVPYPELIIVALLLVTGLSYFSKVLKRRRVFSFSHEGVLVTVFCGFVLVSGLFSQGGARTLYDSLIAVIIMLGAFLTTFNLMKGKRLLGSCVKIIAVSFSVLAIIGVWNVFYDGIVDGVTYSIREYVQPILEGDNLYIADNASVFSVLAILSFPMMFCFMARQKTVKNVVGLLILSTVLLGACFIYGTYETVVTIIIEFIIFWLIYSHKTLNVAVWLLIPIGFFFVGLPYAARYIDLPDVIERLGEYMPILSPESSYYAAVASSTVDMLRALKSGIGAGSHAFVSTVAPYLGPASNGAQNPASFYLQVICWSGCAGMITLLVLVGTMMKKSLGFLAVSKDKSLRTEALALSCSFIAALIFGLVNCLWDDPRMLYLFFAVTGILAAYVREGRVQNDKHDAEFSLENDMSDVELTFHK